MKYLLDTDICIYAIARNPAVLSYQFSHPIWEIGVSVLVEAELRAGAAKSGAPAKNLEHLVKWLNPLSIVDFNSSDAIAYATIRAELERLSTPIGPLDTLIAAQAVARKLILVTNNEREFKRVPGLRVENWAK